MRYHHVDVFTGQAYSGNSLTVFPTAGGLTASQMAQVTRELRHFESIFLQPGGQDGRTWQARVFDLLEELDFAGHPVIGAACVLHALHGTAPDEEWTLRLRTRTVRVATHRHSRGRYSSVLDQGSALFLSRPEVPDVASWFSLRPEHLDPDLRPEVVSTGLRYLVVPVRHGALERARVAFDLQAFLAPLGAQFAYMLDATAIEGRHWNNDGIAEDVATGSAAGCVAAYLRRNGRIGDGEQVTLRQGGFAGRPSEMAITAHGTGTDIPSVEVGGDVAFVGDGRLEVLPQ
ncbi:PhzF family phenazine biosynthesis protein [Streptomyces tropicalis]|uniref:PhzF family phenazine biosynthesis protein n=1 Tax=Streptomyces tropicalis TaxID=3034234 RepID=A0ABT6A473_9ACTN|nr:PhzF family phenazine biosynthesis protein [Streptomyces tropicalis]MDF3299446.1 PhzF family phenazine biosynthesis protein [Streptomyces tropicalis]